MARASTGGEAAQTPGLRLAGFEVLPQSRAEQALADGRGDTVPLSVPVFADQNGNYYVLDQRPEGTMAVPFLRGSQGHSGAGELAAGGFIPRWDVLQTPPAPASNSAPQPRQQSGAPKQDLEAKVEQF